MTFGFSDGSKNLNTLFPSHVRILLRTNKIESLEWLHLVPRLRMGICFEIDIVHGELCDLLRIFLPNVQNHQYR